MSNTIGPRLRAQPAIRDAIAEAMAERSQRIRADAEWVLRRLVAEVEADLADLFDDKNQLKPETEWPLIWRQGYGRGRGGVEARR